MTRETYGMRDILAEISSFDFMRNYEKQIQVKLAKVDLGRRNITC